MSTGYAYCTGWCSANGRVGGCGMTVCPAYTPPQPVELTAVSLDPTPTLMRIADALERIASVLERQWWDNDGRD